MSTVARLVLPVLRNQPARSDADTTERPITGVVAARAGPAVVASTNTSR